MPDTDNFKDKLLTMKSQLLKKTDAIKHDLEHENLSSNWTEQATETENDEVLNSLGEAARTELKMIDTALSRIELGQYFTCCECGGEITTARLELLPYTPVCVDCARLHEEVANVH